MELYETTFSAEYLQKALDLNQVLMADFWDEKSGGFYFTSKHAELLLVRQKEVYDGAIPSGNSVAFLNLLKFAHLTGKAQFNLYASQLEEAFSPLVQKNPMAYTYLFIGVDFVLGPTYEVIIVGSQMEENTKKMLGVLKQKFLPRKVVIFLSKDEANTNIYKIIPKFDLSTSGTKGKAMAYICKDFSCQIPTSSVREMLHILEQ